jgi:hypothetical protein
VVADFNNDGHLDLATANFGDRTVSVLLGDGAGGFGAAIASAAGAAPVSLAVADFDHDGNLDLAAANIYQGYPWMSFLLGNGDGTFQLPTFPHLAALAVAAGDFNGDGNSDLVVSEDDSLGSSFGYVKLLLGNGRGGFGYAPTQEISYPMAAVTVADVNLDGKLDAIAAAPYLGGSNGYALLGNGDGTFVYDYVDSEFVTGPDVRAVAVGDFTGDGIPDLVTAGSMVDVVPGRCDGRFDPPISHAANGSMHTGVAIADINADGNLDAVTPDQDTGTVSVLLGDGDGNLRYTGAFVTGSSPAAVAVGDFNGDGRTDVVAANSGSSTVSVLLNDGAWPIDSTPLLRAHDLCLAEGNTGTALAVFRVTLSAPSDQDVTVRYDTANGTATAGSDYQAASGTLIIPAGETTGTITVLVIGDRLFEPYKTFFVNLSGATNAAIADGQGVGRIMDDEPQMTITNSVSRSEGNTGQPFAFAVTLWSAYDVQVSVDWATADGSAKAGSDYQAASGTLTFAPGETSKTITILANDDRLPEPDETFFVKLSGATYADVVYGQGVGVILNDEPRISIGDVTRYEGKKGRTTLFTFTVTLSAAYDQPVTVSFQTVNGTATTADLDYVAKTGTLSFAPGETTKTITVEVKGDGKREAEETFYLDLLGNSANSLLTKSRGVGTILNDD